MTRTAAATRRSRLLIPAVVLLALAAVGAYLVWAMFLAGEPPAGASLDDAAAVVEPSASATTPPAAAPVASAPGSASAPASAAAGSVDPPEPGASDASASDGIDGTWAVDPSIGSFADYTSAWAGFRVNEVLAQGIGETTAIGRTPSVAGELTIAGQALAAASISVDLTTITSDRPRRDDAIQRALETSQFPAATFTLAQPVELSGVPADGETVAVEAIGDLTIHGVTRSVAFPLEARLVGDTIVVVGSMGVTFSDFGVSMPSAPIVVSVEDSGILELQLFFTRA